MKDSKTMKGGTLDPSLVSECKIWGMLEIMTHVGSFLDATYLVKCLQGFISSGIVPYAISVQNEPQYSNPTYPTTKFTPATEGQIARALRYLMTINNLSYIKLIGKEEVCHRSLIDQRLGYEHNWDTAGDYPVVLMQEAGEVFDGVAFHCYRVCLTSFVRNTPL